MITYEEAVDKLKKAGGKHYIYGIELIGRNFMIPKDMMFMDDESFEKEVNRLHAFNPNLGSIIAVHAA